MAMTASPKGSHCTTLQFLSRP